MGEMAGDGGGRSERDEATKFARKRSHDKMNQHVTGRNLTRAHILCDPVKIRSQSFTKLHTDSNQIAVVTTGSRFAAQL
jgi:hypothetical protein